MQLLLLLFTNSVYYAIACCLGRRIRYLFVITLFKFSGNLKIIGHSVFPLFWIIVIGGLIFAIVCFRYSSNFWIWMFRPNRRNINRIDYKIFHETGQKIIESMADFDREIMSEAKIATDINEFFIVFDLNDLSSDEEIYESLDSASQYSKLYRDIHTELKLKLKDDYDVKYPDYDKITENLRNYMKDAKRKVRVLKGEAEESRQNELKLLKIEQKEERRASLQSEYDFFVSKLERKLRSYDWNSMDYPYDVTAGVNNLELSLDEWFVLHGKLKGLFAEGYVQKFDQNFHDTLKNISEKIDEGKLKLKELNCEREEEVRKSDEIRAQDEQDKIREKRNRLDFEQDIRLAEYKSCAKNLYDEIKVLNLHLCTSCKVDLKALGDYHLLDLKKNLVHFTSDLREILNKITSFSKLVPHCGPEELRMMNELSEMRNDSAADVTRFSNELGNLLRERDISEEKLKNVHHLKIELPKFKGYDSEMDIYTFRQNLKN